MVAFTEIQEEVVSALAGMLDNREDAHDAAQIAFLKCWQVRDALVNIKDVRAWIWRVARNAAKDLRRNAWRRRSRPMLDCLQVSLQVRQASPDEALLECEKMDRLRDAIGGLRAEERDVFVLRHQKGLSFEEIAGQCHSPVGTVKTRMRSALSKLRQSLQEKSRGRRRSSR